MTHAFSITRIKETAMSSTKTRRARYFRKTSLILALALASVAQAKDWSFSKDTLLEPYDVADSVGRWVTYYDSVDIVNHSDDTIYFDSVASKIVKPLNKYCTFEVLGGNKNEFGLWYNSGDSTDENRPILVAPRSEEPFPLLPKGKIARVQLSQILAYECITNRSALDSVTIEMVLFTKNHGKDTIFLQGYAAIYNNPVVIPASIRQSKFKPYLKRNGQSNFMRPQWLLGRTRP